MIETARGADVIDILRRWSRRNARRIVLYLISWMLSLMFMFPFFWTVSSSLKTPVELVEYPPKLFPGGLRIENYYEAWTAADFGRFFINSTIVTVLSLIGAVLTSFIVAY
ncbi:MAG: carbohydrate ABC transporter permease, partial [Synergistales bacterium]|nr:carbohydrate ABC transporter permease [Synergistales bacterium]